MGELEEARADAEADLAQLEGVDPTEFVAFLAAQPDEHGDDELDCALEVDFPEDA